MLALGFALVAAEPIEADLRAHVTFLASDLLLGRDTPSPGLDAAAAYLAAHFERAGLKPGPKGWFLEAEWRGAAVRSVVGVLPGEGPLASSWILCTAHYDHIGVRGEAEDRIHNGANDDASGAAGLIEAARILAESSGPRRSIAFVALWGEEKGLRGSRAFVADPPIPLASIDGVINLEQIGRTDDDEGSTAGSLNLTGHAFSTVTQAVDAAASGAGLKLVRREPQSARYFRASDNLPFAEAGIPAHTISTAYSFPDYHRPGDEAQKIDYSHLAQVVRAAAGALRRLASEPKPPAWMEIPETLPYRKADALRKGVGGASPH
jgi:Zn-dependent M28 family amino/carboxypeptidase